VIVLGALALIATLLLTGVEARAFRLDDARIPANADALMHDNKVVSET
jgi:hypothetical protein